MRKPPIAFRKTKGCTLGVELELQIIDLQSFDLSSSASELLAYLETQAIPATISPELTESMIEVSVGVFDSWTELRERLRVVKEQMLDAADWLNVGLSGGGAHPFQQWQDRQIFDKQRFQKLSSLYGYLAKQFTVFGQHIHVGCESGDQALWRIHALNRFVPHFIALAASSPFFQGEATSFHSSRLNTVDAFPFSGRVPYVVSWDRFVRDHYEPMLKNGVIKSMKDFYWDIRPKPEYGTIELRVCDTPLHVDRAALLAGYLQLLCEGFAADPRAFRESDYMVYSYNRFQACRFGLDGNYIDPIDQRHTLIRDHLLETLAWLEGCLELNETRVELLEQLHVAALGITDAERLLEVYDRSGAVQDVVRFAIDQWKCQSTPKRLFEDAA
ncbi:YbdK family carboxylate-amine ligase [Pirellulaceae bacterium SH467]|jgi:carboxylate-amine ligase